MMRRPGRVALLCAFLGLGLVLVAVFVAGSRSQVPVFATLPVELGASASDPARDEPIPEVAAMSEVRATATTDAPIEEAAATSEVLVQVLELGAPAESGLIVVLTEPDPFAESSAPTDANGVARFTAPRAGPAVVRLEEAASAPAPRPPDDRMDEAARRVLEAFDASRRDPPVYERIDVPEQGTLHVTLRVQAPGAVLGSLLGPFGEPVPGAQVVLAYEGRALGPFQLSTLTDSAGAFAFYAVRPGGYRLQVHMDPRAAPIDPDGHSLLARALPLRTEVQVKPDETSRVVLRLGSGAHDVHGRIVDAGGDPQADVTVLVYAGEIESSPDGTSSDQRVADWGDSVAFVTTDALGRYTVLGMHPGRYRIQAAPEGFIAPAETPKLAHWVAPVDVTIGETGARIEVPTIVVELSRPCVLSGTLVASGTWGNGRPRRREEFVVRARHASSPASEAGAWYPWSAHVQEDGRLALTVEAGGEAAAAGIELRIEHVPSRESKVIVLERPREHALDLGTLQFP